MPQETVCPCGQTKALILPLTSFIVFTALPLEIWSFFIFPQLPTLQDRLNCAHTCQTWRPCALRSVASLLLPNIDKKVFRKMPEEQTTHLRTNWLTAAAQASYVAHNGMACLKYRCPFAGSERLFGFCSQCIWEAKYENLDLEMCVPQLPSLSAYLPYFYLNLTLSFSLSFLLFILSPFQEFATMAETEART